MRLKTSDDGIVKLNNLITIYNITTGTGNKSHVTLSRIAGCFPHICVRFYQKGKAKSMIDVRNVNNKGFFCPVLSSCIPATWTSERQDEFGSRDDITDSCLFSMWKLYEVIRGKKVKGDQARFTEVKNYLRIQLSSTILKDDKKDDVLRTFHNFKADVALLKTDYETFITTTGFS